jgi:hypothetical protein
MPLPKPTPPDEMTGPQLAQALGYLLHRFRDQLNRHDWDTLHEASRRLHQHEGLVRDVLPDLRNRISELEDALPRLLPPAWLTPSSWTASGRRGRMPPSRRDPVADVWRTDCGQPAGAE